MSDLDYGQLRALVAEATEGLSRETPEGIETLLGKPMVFRMGSTEVPFTTTNFALSFSLPNFYFHATTTYAILRANGVALGKTDFLGALRVGA
jgi:hypothetical protein